MVIWPNTAQARSFRKAVRHLDLESSSFKWCVVALLAAFPVFCLFSATYRPLLASAGKPAVLAALVFFFGVRGRRAVWIVGSIVLLCPVLGWASFFSAPPTADLVSLSIPVGYWLAVPMAFAGAAFDTITRVDPTRWELRKNNA